jgi:transposase
MTQRPDLSKLSSDEKDALIVALLERVEELERRLSLNSSNSGKPPASEGLKKPSRVNTHREKTGRKAGGQAGHAGTTLRQVAAPDQVIDYCPPVCAECGTALGLEEATGQQKRQVFDLPKPVVQVTEHRA